MHNFFAIFECKKPCARALIARGSYMRGQSEAVDFRHGLWLGKSAEVNQKRKCLKLRQTEINQKSGTRGNGDCRPPLREVLRVQRLLKLSIRAFVLCKMFIP